MLFIAWKHDGVKRPEGRFLSQGCDTSETLSLLYTLGYSNQLGIELLASR